MILEAFLTNRSAWFRIRKEMFEMTMNEVKERVGREAPDLRAYRKTFDSEMQRRWSISQRGTLLKTLIKTDLALFGDFHALEQSQRTHLRLLDALVGARKIGIGVECVPFSKQKVLNEFLAGQINEPAFLKKIQWERWGFPWDHYQPLFAWAQKNKIPMVALDQREGALRARDKHAARQVVAWKKAHPENLMVVIYGDLHLAADKLPAQIKALQPAMKLVRVFQNCEPAALRLLKKSLDHKVDVIRFDAATYAVQNVPPWVKWQNYLLWLEHSDDQRILHDEERDGHDWTDSVAALVKWINAELQINVDPAGLTVYSPDDPDLWERVKKQASPSTRPWIEMLVEDSRSFYFSQGGWGYLARPSVNHAASLAMQYIHHQICEQCSIKFHMPQDFIRMIWIEAMAYFGSKLVNPKRKSNTLTDIRASLSSRRADDKGREALRIALSQKMRELMAGEGKVLSPIDVRPKSKSSWIAASHLLGALLGERLYNGYRRHLVSLNTIRTMLSKPVGHAQFPIIYQELLEVVESLPAPYKSKEEKL